MNTKKLRKLRIGKVMENVCMSNNTTYRAGGICKHMVLPRNKECLIKLIKYLRSNNIKYKIIGNGSNLLFSDNIYNGVLIRLDKIDNYKIEDTIVKAEAGCDLLTIAYKSADAGLTGLEFATGIPGTIGGAIYMNAGAYKSDMGYVVSEVEVLTPKLEIKKLYNKDLDFHYRSSFLQKNKDYICLEATIVLKKGNKKVIKDIIAERRKKRLMTQPLNFPSAGSVFRNPPDDFAGRLIEECNLKGYKIGDAMVSEKHANFIVNIGKATGKDIHDLILYVKSEVYKKFKIDLLIEQEFVNWE